MSHSDAQREDPRIGVNRKKPNRDQTPALERRRPRRKANPRAAKAAQKALDEMVAKGEARAGAQGEKSSKPVKRGERGHFAEGTAPGPGRPPGSTSAPNVPRNLATLLRYLAEGGLMTDDQKGDPIYVSHLVLDTMLRGLKGLVLKQTVSKKGAVTTTYEARLGWASLLFKMIQKGKDTQGPGNRFEVILPKQRFVRDPVPPEGTPPI